MSVRVLLVDDHAVMRAGFRMILDAEDDLIVVGEASTQAGDTPAGPDRHAGPRPPRPPGPRRAGAGASRADR